MSDDKQLSQCDEEEDYGAASLVKLEAAVEAMGAVAKLKTELDDRRSADVAEYQRTAQKLITHLEKKLEAAEQRVAEAEASLNKKWADISNEELIRVYNERKRSSLDFLDKTEMGDNNYMPRGVNRESNFRQRVVELERELGESDARRVTAERAAAAAEARLVDLRAWGKAVKLFFSALKDANVSARTALCKNPEGAMEKLMEGEPRELTPPDRKPALDEALELEAKITSLLEILQAEAGLPPQKRARGG